MQPSEIPVHDNKGLGYREGKKVNWRPELVSARYFQADSGIIKIIWVISDNLKECYQELRYGAQ